MIRSSPQVRILAVCLSALAGYVDAMGFLASGGLFVSFMSGNSTRLGIGTATGAGYALAAGGLIAMFVVGVIGGTLAGARAGRHRQPLVLGMIAAMLAAAAVCHLLHWNAAALALTAFAMGAENTLFEADGEVRIGLTYMTGTLVKLGQRLAAALTGGERLAWIPYLSLWLGLVGGAIAGAMVHGWIGLAGLWAAAAVAATIALILVRSPVEPG